MPRLLLLDLDGTVLDGSGLPDAMRATCDELAAGLTDVTADEMFAANDAAWRRLWPDVESDYMLGGRRGDAIGKDAWRETLALCGVHDEAVVDRAITLWDRDERASFRLFPDVFGVLERFPRIGMVTNGSADVQRDKLETLGILERFDPLVISSEAGVMKPDPAIFEVAIAASGLSPSDISFVGDNLWHDVPGALAAGIRAIWLDREGVPLRADWPQPDQIIHGLDELP